jgi:hypothetical protein
MINERTFVVDNLVVNQSITAGIAGSPITLNGSIIQAGAGIGSLLYSKYITTGTPWMQPSANALVKIMDQFTLAAGTLTAGRILRIQWYGIHTGANTNVCTQTVNIGGTGAVGATITGGTSAVTFNAIVSGAPFFTQVDIYCQVAASLSRGYGTSNGGATAQLLPIDTALTTDWTQPQLINLTLNNVTTATDASIYGWSVFLL